MTVFIRVHDVTVFIRVHDVNGKTWWHNASAIASITECVHDNDGITKAALYVHGQGGIMLHEVRETVEEIWKAIQDAEQ